MDTIRASFPLTAAQARAVQEAYARSRQLPVDFDLRLSPDVSIQLRLIPPGEFIMGLDGAGGVCQINGLVSRR